MDEIDEKEQIRAIRAVHLLEGRKFNCRCGNKHTISINLFEITDEGFKPKRVVELQCARFYKFLGRIRGASVNNMEFDDGDGKPGFLTRMLRKLFIWRTNKFFKGE